MCGKCGERENQTILPSTANSITDVPTAVKTTHRIQEHAHSRKKEKEILTIKYTRNVPYPEAWKIVEGYIKNKTFFQISPKSESKKWENYQKLISKLLQLGSQDWPKFIQEIKPILLKLSSNSTNPKPMTEHNLEKTS